MRTSGNVPAAGAPFSATGNVRDGQLGAAASSCVYCASSGASSSVVMSVSVTASPLGNHACAASMRPLVEALTMNRVVPTLYVPGCSTVMSAGTSLQATARTMKTRHILFARREHRDQDRLERGPLVDNRIVDRRHHAADLCGATPGVDSARV